MTRAALYARTSTADQVPANQLHALRALVERRGWSIAGEYVDDGISSTKARPELDRLVKDARRGRFEVVVAWRLDRLGRSLRALVLLLDDLTTINVSVVTENDGIDLSTPTGRLMTHMIAAFAQYERDIIVDRVRAGLARARREGKRLGRPPANVTAAQLHDASSLSLRAAAKKLRVSHPTIAQWRKHGRG